jgi:hypothetical protein
VTTDDGWILVRRAGSSGAWTEPEMTTYLNEDHLQTAVNSKGNPWGPEPGPATGDVWGLSRTGTMAAPSFGTFGNAAGRQFSDGGSGTNGDLRPCSIC